MKVLHIDSSVRGEWSVSKDLSRHFINQLLSEIPQAEIDYLDLSVETPPHPSPIFIRGNYSPAADRTPEMLEALKISDSLVNRMHNAGVIVIGVPMHNFSIPSILKAFIDNIVRINETFSMDGEGIKGLLVDKKVYIITTRGADFNVPQLQGMDQITPYMKAVFGFMGMTDLQFVDVSPVQFADQEARNLAIDKGKKSINKLVSNLAVANTIWKI